MAKQDDYVRYTIRVPAALYARIQFVADNSGRSINAEIMGALEEKYPPIEHDPDVSGFFAAYMQALSELRELRKTRLDTVPSDDVLVDITENVQRMLGHMLNVVDPVKLAPKLASIYMDGEMPASDLGDRDGSHQSAEDASTAGEEDRSGRE